MRMWSVVEVVSEVELSVALSEGRSESATRRLKVVVVTRVPLLVGSSTRKSARAILFESGSRVLPGASGGGGGGGRSGTESGGASGGSCCEAHSGVMEAQNNRSFRRVLPQKRKGNERDRMKKDTNM